ncbi:hypothetical protein Pjdr2_3942 [Paenibacillus sp. JDR-2]|nr:hypothetical protein Pjdr2_3942 [Paenibacillus sp. JDR-2]
MFKSLTLIIVLCLILTGCTETTAIKKPYDSTSLTFEKPFSGQIYTYNYDADFSFQSMKPNHSDITSEEDLNFPIGNVKLITLDADNGTAASGITGTHDVYFAIIPIKDKVIYVLEYSSMDKNPETKQLFMEILHGVRFTG